MTRTLHPHERLSVYGPIGQTLQQHKLACAQRRLAKIRPLGELAQIFRAMIGDRKAQAVVPAHVAAMYEHGPTFGEFLRVNRLPAYEQVLR
jgi:hypothetical protein